MEDIRKKIVEMPENLPEIPKDMLQYAQKDEVLYDANPETISRGFFKDALVRLRKNKASIAAFWILCFIAFMAIFGPDMNEYTFSQQFSDYTNMPPRVQFLEDFGIFDGRRVVTNRRLDSLENTEKFPAGSVLGYSNPHEVRGVTLVDVEVNYYKYIGADDLYFWFGTDSLGRDMWTRLWKGSRISLIIAFVSTFCNVCIGLVYGRR